MTAVISLGLRGLAAGRGTTAMLIAAVALGIGFQIPNTANLDGLHAALLEDGLAFGAGDLRVEPRDRARFAGDHPALASLRRRVDDGALPARAIVPSLVFPGALATPRTAKLFGAPVIGIDPALPVPYHVIAGAPLEPGQPLERGVLVGATIAQRLRLAVGDRVELHVVYGSAALDDNTGTIATTVQGIVTSSNGAYRFVFVDRGRLGDAAGTPGAASAIAIHLDDHAAAATTRPLVAATVPDARVATWRDDEPGFASYLDARDVIGAVSYAMVIAAIAIPMWALLYIQVLRRRRELAILRGLGFTRRDVFATCVVQAVALALAGAALGTGLGYAAIRYFAANPLFEWESLQVRPVTGVATFAVPAAIAIATSIAAALHPAWRASRIEPAGVLRRLE